MISLTIEKDQFEELLKRSIPVLATFAIRLQNSQIRRAHYPFSQRMAKVATTAVPGLFIAMGAKTSSNCIHQHRCV